MQNRFQFAFIFIIALSLLGETAIAASANLIKVSTQLQEIKDDVTSSAEHGELKILFEKTYQANSLHFKKKIKIEQGKSYDIFSVMDKSPGVVTTKLFDSDGIVKDFDAGEFENDGIKYSGHTIKSAEQSQELILQVVTDQLANGTLIYLAVLELLEPQPNNEQPEPIKHDDNYFKTTIKNMAYVRAYSLKNFSVVKASELPIIFEMRVHEGNDYQVITTFSTTDAKPRVIVADPDRGNGLSEDDEYIASFEIRTEHKGVKTYYVKIEKASGNLRPDEHVYIYTGYRTSSNIGITAKAAENELENYFSNQSLQ